MKINKTAVAIILGCLSYSTFAADDNNFQHQLSLGATDTVNTDYSTDTFWSTSYQYFFSPVSQKKGPYALNGWLAQTSEFSVGIDGDSDFLSYDIAGQYVFNNKWFAKGNYHYNDFDVAGDPSSNQYRFGLGYFVDEWSRVEINYSRNELDGLFGGSNTDSYNVYASRYFSLNGDSGALISADYSTSKTKVLGNTRSADIFGLKTDYYFNKSWSLGVSYQNNSKTDDIYALNTSYFWRLSNQISLIGNASKIVEPNQDRFDLGLTLLGRF